MAEIPDTPRVLTFEDEVDEIRVMPGAPVLDEVPPPALFIGLGGSGVSMVGRIARRVVQIFGHGEAERVPASFQFLALDTDPRSRGYVQGLPVTYIAASNINGDSVLQNAFRRMHEDSWPKPFWPGLVRDGAHQVRAVGHLAFAWQLSQDWDRIERSFSALQQAVRPEAPTPVVYVLGSVCGGTGAGMAFDVAYLAAWLLRSNTPDVVGVLLSPTAFDDVNEGDAPIMVKVNAYAFLKEADRFFDHSDYPLDHLQHTETRGMHVGAYGRVRPFQVLYIVGEMDVNGRRVGGGRERLCGLVAEHVLSQYLGYQQFAAEHEQQAGEAVEGANVVSSLDNALLSLAQRDPDGNAPMLSSLGLSAYVYPRMRVHDYAITQWSYEVLTRCFLAGSTEFSPEVAAGAFMRKVKIEEREANELLDQLLALPAEAKLSQTLDVSTDALLADPLDGTISRLDEFESRLRSELKEAVDAVGSRANEIESTVIEELRTWCTQTCSVSAGGIGGLSRALSVLNNFFAACSEQMHAELRESQAKLGLLDNSSEQKPGKLQKAREAVAQACQTRRWIFWPDYESAESAAAEYLKHCRDLAGLSLKIAAREKAISLYELWSGHIGLLRQGAERLSTDVQRWADRCAQHAYRLLRFGPTAEVGRPEAGVEHLHFALDGGGIEQLYQAFVQTSFGDDHSGALSGTATTAEKTIGGSLWRWVEWDERQVGYVPRPQGELVAGALERAAAEALTALFDKGLLDVLGVDNLCQRAREMARDCQELWSLDESKLPGQGPSGLISMAFLLMPSRDGAWARVAEVVAAEFRGAQVRPVVTRDPDRIILARARFGAPVKALRNAENWYQLYREQVEAVQRWITTADPSQRMQVKPPHLCRGWEEWREPLGEEVRGAEEWFGLGLVTPLPSGVRVAGTQNDQPRSIVHLQGQNMGGFYYLHRYPETGSAATPASLGQGLLRAYHSFRSGSGVAAVEAWFADPTQAAHSVLSVGVESLAGAMRPGLERLRVWRDGLSSQEQDYQAKLDILEKAIRAVEQYMIHRLNVTP